MTSGSIGCAGFRVTLMEKDARLLEFQRLSEVTGRFPDILHRAGNFLLECGAGQWLDIETDGIHARQELRVAHRFLRMLRKGRA